MVRHSLCVPDSSKFYQKEKIWYWKIQWTMIGTPPGVGFFGQKLEGMFGKNCWPILRDFFSPRVHSGGYCFENGYSFSSKVTRQFEQLLGTLGLFAISYGKRKFDSERLTRPRTSFFSSSYTVCGLLVSSEFPEGFFFFFQKQNFFNKKRMR